MRARALLESEEINYKEINISSDGVLAQEMVACSGRHSVPQIFINDVSICGFEELVILNQSGKLD